MLGENKTVGGRLGEETTVDDWLDEGFFDVWCWGVEGDSNIFGIDGEIGRNRFLEGIEGRTTGWEFEREI